MCVWHHTNRTQLQMSTWEQTKTHFVNGECYLRLPFSLHQVRPHTRTRSALCRLYASIQICLT